MSFSEFLAFINERGVVPHFTGASHFVYWLSLAAVLLFSYLLGSVNSAIIISKALFKEDIRTKGSGNAGMTNMLRVYGKKAAVLTLVGDMMKTVISVALGGVLFGFDYVGGLATSAFPYLAAMAAAIGHVFPCFYLFKGGKGVLVTATMALILSPFVFLALFVIFVIAVAIWKYISLGSVTVAVLYPVALDFYFQAVIGAGAEEPVRSNGLLLLSTMILAVLIVWCHRENLKRITERTENKFSFGKKKNEEE